MAKFGLFKQALQVPMQTFAGDYMLQERDCVKIFKRNPTKSQSDIQIVAIKLDKGQLIRELGGSASSQG